VNGKGPYRFVIDSGAAGLMRITSALQQTLGLAKVGEAQVGDPSGKNMQTRAIVHLDSVTIDAAQFSGVDAVVGDIEDGDGVISLNLFAGLTATLDYPKSQLRLSLQPLPASAPHVVAFTAGRGVPQIAVDIAGSSRTVDVDTGSPALLSIPSEWMKSIPFSGEAVVVGHGRTVTNEFEIRAAELKGELRVAGYSESNPRVDIVDLFPVANLGSRFLRQYAVTFDMANNRLALEK
jgi:Aspartyl protease